MFTAILTLAIVAPAALALLYAAKKLDARDRKAGRFMQAGGTLSPRKGTTGRLLF